MFSFIFSSINKEVEEIINNMTLKEKIAQMIMVRVRSNHYASDNYYKKEGLGKRLINKIQEKVS